MKLTRLLLSALGAATCFACPLAAAAHLDRQIEEAAKASYNFRTLLQEDVAVEAHDGVVTLTGMVVDKDLQSIAEDTVSSLPGVARVDNHVTLEAPLKEHSDAWIAWKIRWQLLARAGVNHRDTKVSVLEGVVTLTGCATSAAKRQLVRSYAADVAGVQLVKNRIIVLAAPAGASPPAESVDDASITSQVRHALLTHRSTRAIVPGVVTTEGVVVLTGRASSPAQRSLVAQLAGSIRGVKAVTNDMTVKR